MPLSEVAKKSKFSAEAKDAMLTHIKGLQRALQAKDNHIADLEEQLKKAKEDIQEFRAHLLSQPHN